MNYRGFFLNLERNQQRRDTLLANLEDVGAKERYERFEAVNGREAHVHILEDDAFLARDAVEVLDGLLPHLDETLPTWDLLFTDTFVQAQTGIFYPLLQKMREFTKSGTYGIVDLRTMPFACTTSMLINKRSIDKYLSVMTGNWKVGLPIDLFIRQQVVSGKLRAHVTVPFITTLSPESSNSDIRGSMDRSRRIFDTLRRGFFKEANAAALQTEMQQLVAGAKVSPLAALYLNAEMFTLSDQWESF